ncbi:AGE family epimerase/isomerase [Marinomonas agarivorans]|nr:AGE family epimerase/isomerase [Marinomonas agarivorans]
MKIQPTFREPAFLQQHIEQTMEFYHPRCIDKNGGFFHFFKDNGNIYDKETRHLVSSTRFVFNYAKAYQHTKNPEYLEAVQHGIRYLRERHKKADGGYVWLLKGQQDLDKTNHCYGLAFVMLAYAEAYRCGMDNAKSWLAETYQLMEQHFWDDKYGLYRDEITDEWLEVSPYRGQNANMHSCEAMLTAYDATQELHYLHRAELLAQNICQRQASLSDGQIWEHFDAQWQIDWDYNLDNPKHLFRPWGFQPGHQTEWTKLLLILNDRSPKPWLVETAKALFDNAWSKAWDHTNKGLYYGYAPDNQICDDDKYFWVQAESFAAAAWLAKVTGEEKYWGIYEQIWSYAWDHMIDHKYGAWYRILTADNHAYDDCKSPAGKTDYHTMGACYEVLSLLKR